MNQYCHEEERPVNAERPRRPICGRQRRDRSYEAEERKRVCVVQTAQVSITIFAVLYHHCKSQSSWENDFSHDFLRASPALQKLLRLTTDLYRRLVKSRSLGNTLLRKADYTWRNVGVTYNVSRSGYSSTSQSGKSASGTGICRWGLWKTAAVAVVRLVTADFDNSLRHVQGQEEGPLPEEDTLRLRLWPQLPANFGPAILRFKHFMAKGAPVSLRLTP